MATSYITIQKQNAGLEKLSVRHYMVITNVYIQTSMLRLCQDGFQVKDPNREDLYKLAHFMSFMHAKNQQSYLIQTIKFNVVSSA